MRQQIEKHNFLIQNVPLLLTIKVMILSPLEEGKFAFLAISYFSVKVFFFSLFQDKVMIAGLKLCAKKVGQRLFL